MCLKLKYCKKKVNKNQINGDVYFLVKWHFPFLSTFQQYFFVEITTMGPRGVVAQGKSALPNLHKAPKSIPSIGGGEQ